MKRSVFASVVIICALAAPATTATAQQRLILEGAVDCGVWVEARKADQASNLESHLLGLLNGMSVGRGVEFWMAGGIKISRAQVFLWMDNYCTSHPLETPTIGAVVLME